MTRDQAIAAIESAPPWSSFEMKDPRVVTLTEDSGVVVYSVVAQRSSHKPNSAVISSTFVRRDDGWKLAFHQQDSGLDRHPVELRAARPPGQPRGDR